MCLSVCLYVLDIIFEYNGGIVPSPLTFSLSVLKLFILLHVHSFCFIYPASVAADVESRQA